MKYLVSSTLKPALARRGDGSVRVIGGTVHSVNGNRNPDVPAHVGIQDLVWVEAPRMAPKAVKPKTVQVVGKSGTYTVTWLDARRATCTCPGFHYRRTCRHVVQAVPPR